MHDFATGSVPRLTIRTPRLRSRVTLRNPEQFRRTVRSTAERAVTQNSGLNGFLFSTARSHQRKAMAMATSSSRVSLHCSSVIGGMQ